MHLSFPLFKYIVGCYQNVTAHSKSDNVGYMYSMSLAHTKNRCSKMNIMKVVSNGKKIDAQIKFLRALLEFSQANPLSAPLHIIFHCSSLSFSFTSTYPCSFQAIFQVKHLSCDRVISCIGGDYRDVGVAFSAGLSVNINVGFT